jgi:hypothetical protein
LVNVYDRPAPPREGFRDPLPPRLLPVLYVSAAHLALTLAAAAVALDPRGVAGFFYHSRLLAIVHLITLGWISCSILGALYIAAPIALRTPIRVRRTDYGACALIVIGITGMVAHFWLDRPSGMAWSASTVAAGVLVAAARLVPPVASAPIPAAVRAHVTLAFANIGGAAAMGVLIGFDKVHHFLGGFVLSNVFAHAHLAAIGWASMMVVGVGYRLLPMVLPSAMPAGTMMWMSALLIEAGVVGLFASLLLRAVTTPIFAVTIVAGIAAFLSRVVWMLRHRRTPPPALRLPDPAVLHAAAAFVWLVTACGLGVWLTFAPTSPSSLRVATAYGVFGLIGFLAQIVVAMEGRLLPLFAWYWAFANRGGGGPVRSPHEMAWHGAQQIVFVLWLAGVPALAAGLAFDAVPFVSGGAWSLLAAALIESANTLRILRHAFPARGRTP